MKRHFIIASLVLLSLLLTSCASPTPVPTPTPTPVPKCQGNVCIRQVFVTITDDNMLIQFDLVDRRNEVKFGNEPQFQGELVVGVFHIEPDGTDNYLFGAKLPPAMYNCYSGNDLPWTNGQLGASCGFAFPTNQMQAVPQIGDVVRIEVVGFDFEQMATVEKGD